MGTADNPEVARTIVRAMVAEMFAKEAELASKYRKAVTKNLEKARAEREALAKQRKENERVLVCSKGCRVTLYVKGDAWCVHGKMELDDGR
jgi:hypothetical protein